MVGRLFRRKGGEAGTTARSSMDEWDGREGEGSSNRNNNNNNRIIRVYVVAYSYFLFPISGGLI